MNQGFAYIRHDKVHGFDLTKRGLLIGYDMMPLLGLRRMERRLLKRGTIERVRLASDPKARKWGAVKNGQPLIAFASWQGGLSDSRRRAFQSLAGFVLDEVGDNAVARRLLYRLWWPTLYKRRAPKLERQARELICRLGYKVSRMKFERN